MDDNKSPTTDAQAAEIKQKWKPVLFSVLRAFLASLFALWLVLLLVGEPWRGAIGESFQEAISFSDVGLLGAFIWFASAVFSAICFVAAILKQPPAKGSMSAKLQQIWAAMNDPKVAIPLGFIAAWFLMFAIALTPKQKFMSERGHVILLTATNREMDQTVTHLKDKIVQLEKSNIEKDRLNDAYAEENLKLRAISDSVDKSMYAVKKRGRILAQDLLEFASEWNNRISTPAWKRPGFDSMTAQERQEAWEQETNGIIRDSMERRRAYTVRLMPRLARFKEDMASHGADVSRLDDRMIDSGINALVIEKMARAVLVMSQD